MLVQIVRSLACRGWECNDSEIVETDHKTLKTFVIEHTGDPSLFESADEDDENSDWLGLVPGGSEKDGYHVQADEDLCTSYYIFKPTKGFVDMINRNFVPKAKAKVKRKSR